MSNITTIGDIIKIRSADKFINLTHLCKYGNGTKPCNWYRTGKAMKLIRNLEQKMDQCVLYVGHHRGSPTWCHPTLAIAVASWISPEYGIKVINALDQL